MEPHGAAEWRRRAAPGFLALHGFTGNPSSMRGFAQAMAGAGFHVELPRLPGHGTTVDDMKRTRWDDWTAAVAAAHERLAARAGDLIVGGQSMGAALALWLALHHPELAGLVFVNPACQPQGPEVREMLEQTLGAGTEEIPGVGSDLADPDAREIAYESTPVRPLVSLLDGLDAIGPRYGELQMPLLLFTSRQDHVVDPAQSEFLAGRYGGDVDHRWLERSYHVATQDFDRDVIFTESIDFARRVTDR